MPIRPPISSLDPNSYTLTYDPNTRSVTDLVSGQTLTDEEIISGSNSDYEKFMQIIQRQMEQNKLLTMHKPYYTNRSTEIGRMERQYRELQDTVPEMLDGNRSILPWLITLFAIGLLVIPSILVWLASSGPEETGLTSVPKCVGYLNDKCVTK